MEAEYKKGVLVKADNKLVTSHYSMSVEEQRLIFHLASSIRTDDDDFTEYTFSLRQLHEIVGKHITIEEADALGLQLMKRVLRFDSKDNNHMVLAHWIATFKRDRSKELFSIKLHHEMQPLLLELKEHFTTIPLLHACQLRSAYAVRLYLLLCEARNKEQKRFEISIEELRSMLEIPKKEYKKGSDFKRRIITEPIAEINSESDFYVEVKDIRRGGRFRGSLMGFEFSFLCEELPKSGKYIKQRSRVAKHRKSNELSLLPDHRKISEEDRISAVEHLRRVKQEISASKSSAN